MAYGHVEYAALDKPVDKPTEEKNDSFARINDLGAVLTRCRKTAIDARAQSGIENIWLEDEDAYEGIDDNNRAEEHAGSRYRYAKPRTTSGSVTETSSRKKRKRSTVFLNITESYVKGTAERTADMLFPTGENPWELDPTPIPELTRKEQIPPEVFQLAEEANKIANDRAELAGKQIDDWLKETKWESHVRTVIRDSERVGTGILKGPFPELRKQQVYHRDEAGQVQIEINEEMKPGSKAVSYWNCFPDPLCGEDIHKGSYFWERDDITKRVLRNLRNQPGYIKEQIDACLTEGPQRAVVNEKIRREDYTDDCQFEIWHYYGDITLHELEAAGFLGNTDKLSEEGGEPQEDPYAEMRDDPHAAFPAIVSMVNERVIRAVRNPLDDGSFPFDFVVSEVRNGLPWGRGTGRKVRTPQRIINAAVRALMDNAGVTAGPLLAMLKGVVQPTDGVPDIAPWKMYWVENDSDNADVSKAIQAINLESNQANLIAIIMFAMEMAEKVTGFPLLMQGQQGDAPDRVGIVQILNQNANSVLRGKARLIDSSLIEPHIGRYYQWLMVYGKEEEAKGLFIVVPRGSSVLAEREFERQSIMELWPVISHPLSGKDPRKGATEMLRARRLDPERFDFDDEQWQQIVANYEQIMQQMSKPQEEDKTSVAQINAQAKLETKKMELEHASQESDKQRQFDAAIAMIENELDALSLEGDQAAVDKQVKAMLAKAVMDAKTKFNLQSKEAAIKDKHGEGL
jgi:hypothetical protein